MTAVTTIDSEQPRTSALCAYTIDGFCRAHGISRSTFYNLLREGQGPRVMRVRSAVRISYEAASDWRRALEADRNPTSLPLEE